MKPVDDEPHIRIGWWLVAFIASVAIWAIFILLTIG